MPTYWETKRLAMRNLESYQLGIMRNIDYLQYMKGLEHGRVEHPAVARASLLGRSLLLLTTETYRDVSMVFRTRRASLSFPDLKCAIERVDVSLACSDVASFNGSIVPRSLE
jgi:hypothetical protein